MNFQEQQQAKLENMNYVENAKKAVVYHDPITRKMVVLQGSASMDISMEEYAALRVPTDIQYTIIGVNAAPNESLPDLNFNHTSSDSLNMFYRYLNAL
jgi:hypothetical protein